MVVRNPYDRIISEFYCPFNGLKHINDTVNIMNSYITRKITGRQLSGNHFTEQWLYIDKNVNIKIHILKFENLKEEFDQLMKQYDIDLVLDIHINKGVKTFGVKDISRDNINLINRIYKKDFELFNYTMIQ